MKGPWLVLAALVALAAWPGLAWGQEICTADSFGKIQCHGGGPAARGRVDENGRARLHGDDGRQAGGRVNRGGGTVFNDGRGGQWLGSTDQYGNGSAYDGRGHHMQCHRDSAGATVCY